MAKEDKNLILTAARVLYEVLQGKHKITCLKNGILFEENDYGYAEFEINGHLFTVFCKAGSFRYIENFKLVEEETIECDWFFPDDVIRMVFGYEEFSKLEDLFLEAAKGKQ